MEALKATAAREINEADLTGKSGKRAIFPIYRHHSFRRLPLGIRDWESGSCNQPPARTRRPPSESGGEPVRPSGQPATRSIRRFSSLPPCLCRQIRPLTDGEGWSVGLGRSPLQGSGLMGVSLTQAVGLGFVRSPLWGSKTTSDLARLGFVRATLRLLSKRGTKAVVARR
jgi:hypothetical protein